MTAPDSTAAPETDPETGPEADPNADRETGMSFSVLSLPEIEALVLAVLVENGLDPAQARAVADTVTRAEADGCRSHGLYRVPGYVAALRSGRVNPAARPSVRQVAPALISVDGDGGFAPEAVRCGTQALTDATRRNGIAAMAVGRCHHFSALWADVEPFVAAGLVVWAYVVGQNSVAPHGGTRPLMGTNPLAFGWPRPGAEPFVFDFATSATARGEVELRALAGQDIPAGWALDAAGQPTTDPAAALGGALLPFGGHKGSALSLMVELIAGPLIGELSSQAVAGLGITDGGPPPGGELFIALDPAAFGTGTTQAEDIFAAALSQPGVRLPSERRYRARARSRTAGVEVATTMLRQIGALRARA